MTRRRLFAVLTGFACAGLAACLAGLLSPVSSALSALVFGLCTLPVGFGVGWIVFIAPTAEHEQFSDDDVESRWLDKALSGTATDLITVIGVGLTALSITRADVPSDLLLLGLLLFAAASCTVRYARRRRATLSA